ncbi:hypothetical protein TNCV_4727351 [Trichonephila clavipes]|nr:hypothetical protein TNCV_4727351 [Trichonephila clavipes]
MILRLRMPLRRIRTINLREAVRPPPRSERYGSCMDHRSRDVLYEECHCTTITVDSVCKDAGIRALAGRNGASSCDPRGVAFRVVQ